MSEPISIDFSAMQDASGGFPPEAFQFVREGLSHTVQTIHGAEQIEADESQHVSGQELCLGLRDYALDQYGRLTRMVFRKWGLTETADFGRIVFAMIDAGLMRKTDEDNFDDFVGVYDFDEAFDPRAVN